VTGAMLGRYARTVFHSTFAMTRWLFVQYCSTGVNVRENLGDDEKNEQDENWGV
jgi:hypothetical protein